MGRETRILLGFLGLLAGLFIGVLSLKLLVPRPPAGAGPDVHGDMAFPVRQAIVPPPAPGPRAWDYAAAPPLVVTAGPADGAEPTPPGVVRVESLDDAAVVSPSPFDRDELVIAAGHAATATPTRDPFVQPTALNDTELAEPAPPRSRFSVGSDAAAMDTAALPVGEPSSAEFSPPPSTDRFSRFGVGRPSGSEDDVSRAALEEALPPVEAGFAVAARDASQPSARPDAFAIPPAAAPTFSPATSPRADGPVAGSHVVVSGDSWWTLAERAYGDGRLYRALYAWNRAQDPRVSLLPGTRLDVPPVDRLTTALPGLVPTPR